MTTPKTKVERTGLARLGPTDRVGIIAGDGRLPVNLATKLVEDGQDPFIVMVEGEADRGSILSTLENDTLAVEEIARLVPMLKQHGVTHVIMAGGVRRRPDWRKVRPSLGLLALLPSMITALARGDDGLLKVLVANLEKRGLRVLGAHEIMPDLLATEGAMTRSRPTPADRRDLDAALAAARAIGALDIGQGAVAIGGRVIALEGIEGTDGLLARVGELRGHGRLAGRKRGVLVKCAKPGQELRADLPTIGPSTIEQAHAAGLAGVGVEAERSLVLDFAQMAARADALGLFVVGLPKEGGS
jgi:DUF1009 family protein